MSAVFQKEFRKKEDVMNRHLRIESYLKQLELWAEHRLNSFKVMATKNRQEKLAEARLSIYTIGYIRLNYTFNDGLYIFWSKDLPGLCASGKKLNQILYELKQIISNLCVVIYGAPCQADLQQTPQANEMNGEVVFLIRPVNEE